MQLTIGTRASPLALAQATEVERRLKAAWPEMHIRILPMTTSGDRLQQDSLAKIGGKGLFVKEIEEALLDGRVDIAVHSMKDVPARQPEGLGFAAILEREDPRDALIGGADIRRLEDLPHGAIVGTSSTRRGCFLQALRPDITIAPFRGNVQTRLDKLARGDVQATFLAVAGLNRLGMQQHITAYLPPSLLLPAVAQGAIGIECRSADHHIREWLQPLNHPDSERQVTAERAVLKALGADCTTPLAAHATLLPGGRLSLETWLAAGSGIRKAQGEAHCNEAENLGAELANRLLAAA